MIEKFQIGERVLEQDGPPFLVADVGFNHDGDLDQARRLIDAVAEAGADAASFRTFRAEEVLADRTVTWEYESGGRIVREPAYELLKRLELPPAWHAELQAHAHDRGIAFLASSADADSATLLSKLGVPAVKIESAELVNLPLLEHISRLRTPVILATGMADEAEIRRAMDILWEHGCPNVLLLHTVCLYPTPDEQTNLRRMVRLSREFEAIVGYSDHTRGSVAALTAIALGAVLVEKLFTLDPSLPGPQHASSASPTEFAKLIQDAHRVAAQRGANRLEPAPDEQAARRQLRRSVAATQDLPPGTVLTREMLCLKRPGTGIPASELRTLLGRRTRHRLAANQLLQSSDVE